MKLSTIASYLNNLFNKIRTKGEERIKNTLNTFEHLIEKKSKYKEIQGFKIDYALPIEDQFNFFSYKKSKHYPGIVSYFNDHFNQFSGNL